MRDEERQTEGQKKGNILLQGKVPGEVNEISHENQW